MPPRPRYIYQEWVISGHEHVSIKLMERPGINFYTSVEIVQDDGSRLFVQGSARGHGTLAKAESRVDDLLNGGWRDWVKGQVADGH
jgi:hypothetical protein